jgi:hypothetical protein
MKKDKLRPAALFVFVLAAALVSIVFSARTSAVTEEARTLQMIAPYRIWGKANVQPIVVPIEKMALAG